jgi:hypothetical protein
VHLSLLFVTHRIAVGPQALVFYTLIKEGYISNSRLLIGRDEYGLVFVSCYRLFGPWLLFLRESVSLLGLDFRCQNGWLLGRFRSTQPFHRQYFTSDIFTTQN